MCTLQSALVAVATADKRKNEESKAKIQTTTFKPTVKVSRPGVHAKTKTSSIKTSKVYKKKYKGQGK
jgi:hypothetical protein